MAKLALQEVTLPHPNGPYTREAYVIGQLAITEEFNGVRLMDYFTVTHIQSGCYIAKYGKRSDAVEFSKRSQELFDFNAYLVVVTMDKMSVEWKDAIDDMRLLRESLPSYISIENDSNPVSTIEYLRGLVNAQ